MPVRELENCIERAVALGDRRVIDLPDLPPALNNAGAQLDGATLSMSSNDLEAIERATIQRVFDQVKGDKVTAGKMLGISRATLYRKLKLYKIRMNDFE